MKYVWTDVWLDLMIMQRVCFTYIFNEQRVACDSLHGFEKEAGQRHSFTAVVRGYLLLGRK